MSTSEASFEDSFDSLEQSEASVVMVEDPEPESVDPEEERKQKMEMLQRRITTCVKNIAQSYCKIEPKGTRIVVVAQRSIPANTPIVFPGSETSVMARDMVANVFKKLNQAAKEHGEDVDFGAWYMQVYNYSCVGDGIAVPTAGFHAIDMATYVRRTSNPSAANAAFREPRLCVTSKDVPAGTELVALVSDEEYKIDQLRQATAARDRTLKTGKAARRARHRAKKKAQKEAKRKLREGESCNQK